MNLVGRQVTVTLRDAPLVPEGWGRHVGVPVVAVGQVAEQSELGVLIEPLEVVHFNNGTKGESAKEELPFRALFIPWRSVSSVAMI